jgi:hypothetical protein
MALSPHRRGEIIDALRRGTVPRFGLDALAVGIDRFAATLDQELTALHLGAVASKPSVVTMAAERHFLDDGSKSELGRKDS